MAWRRAVDQCQNRHSRRQYGGIRAEQPFVGQKRCWILQRAADPAWAALPQGEIAKIYLKFAFHFGKNTPQGGLNRVAIEVGGV